MFFNLLYISSSLAKKSKEPNTPSSQSVILIPKNFVIALISLASTFIFLATLNAFKQDSFLFSSRFSKTILFCSSLKLKSNLSSIIDINSSTMSIKIHLFTSCKSNKWFIMSPVQEILSIQYSLASAKAAIGRINKVLELKTESDGNIELKDKKIDITLKNLTFSYTEDKTTLKNISFSIKSGEKVAIIGASGSGKTTISQLIAGFYAKNSGDILYNDISIDNISKKSLREHIFLVLQMPILFNNTLRFNLTMGEDISNEKIKEALKIAQLNSMLENLPDGLDTIVGKMGIRLSGGQRQRLSIARMILANPSVVIFDESTSALDVQTETKLFENLENILKDKTVITIAHRLSTVKNASKIFVLEDGELVQSGTHLELEDKTGHYKDFVKHQLIN